MYQATTAYHKIASLKKRIRIIQGGTSAGKTVAILLYLISAAQTQDELKISVVAESIPNLKRGAMRDFLSIMKAHNYFNETNWNRSDYIYTFENGSYIEFFSADNPDKLRGPRRDILFMNECNNVPYTAFDQLEVRTRILVILDYNPVAEFWVHEEVIPRFEHDFIILTYKDNEALEPSIVASIESRRHNENWWKIYGLGQLGFNEGQIFKDWRPIETIPDTARLARHGNDYGYTNDPSAIIDVYEWNNAIILDEVLYETGKSNKELANAIRLSEGLDAVDEQNRFHDITKILTVADSAEPKSIDEMKRYGVKIIPAVKGPGSINYGIQIMQDLEIYVTTRSVNLWKEQRNYLWKIDRDGKSLNIPEDQFNHGMDASRYAISDMKSKRKIRTFANKPDIFM